MGFVHIKPIVDVGRQFELSIGGKTLIGVGLREYMERTYKTEYSQHFWRVFYKKSGELEWELEESVNSRDNSSPSVLGWDVLEHASMLVWVIQ